MEHRVSSVSERNYWLTIFSIETWQEFLEAGAETAGFQEIRASLVKKLQPGDYLLCYVTKISRWVGILEVVSGYFVDRSPIWRSGVFPCRVKVKAVICLTPDTAVPVLEMRDELTVFQNLANPKIWSGAFRVSPFQWKASDGEAVVSAVKEASENSVIHET